MIDTPRLHIRPFAPNDAVEFYALTQDSGFTAYPITDYRQASVDSAHEWICRARELNATTGLGKWAVCDRGAGELLGMGGLTPWNFDGESMVDITYRLRTRAWGQGYGTELALALRDFGFEVSALAEITATITPDNLASLRIAEKIGMRFARRITLLGVETELLRMRRGN